MSLRRTLLERKRRGRARDPKDHPELWGAVKTLADPSSHSDHVRTAATHLHGRFASSAGAGSRIAHNTMGRVHTPDAARDAIQRMHSGTLGSEDPRESSGALRQVAAQYHRAVRAGEVDHHPRVFAGFVKRMAFSKGANELAKRSTENKNRYRAQKELARSRRQSPSPRADAADPAERLGNREKRSATRAHLRGHIDQTAPKAHRPFLHDFIDHHLAGNFEHGRSARAKSDPSVMTKERLAKKHGHTTVKGGRIIKDFMTSARENKRLQGLYTEWSSTPRTLVALYEARDAYVGGELALLRGIFGAIG